MTPAAPRKRKLFFALWPDEATRQRLVDATRDISAGGVRMPAANLHMTLVFVGYVDETTQRCMEAAAQLIDMPSFVIQLDRIDSFGQKILWAGSSKPPEALFTLQAQLDTRLADACGYQPEARRYRPHVTLERKLKQPLQAELDAPVIWKADRFALVESITSPEQGAPPRYEPLRFWSLSPHG